MALTIYGGSRSPNVRKVKLLAAELGIAFEQVTLGLGDLKKPEYLGKNPNGKVPTIDDDGFVLWESGAILRYLASKHPERGLVPSDARAAARVDQWLLWWTSHPEAALYALVVEKLVKPFLNKEGEPALVRDAEQDLARYLPVLDAQLAGKEYVTGALSIVDFAVAPWMEAAPGLGADLTKHGNVHAWLERMQSRPCWKAAPLG